MADPIYTPQTCRNPAYQLNWSYTLFWRVPPTDFRWFAELRRLNEPDHIRILQHEFEPPQRSQFLISTRATVAPLLIAQRVKGRLQRLLVPGLRKPFRRNYAIRSLGSSKRSVVERYLASQLQHHRSFDRRFEERLRPYQISFPEVDLRQPERTSHAIYWYNLHLVLVSSSRHVELREWELAAIRDMILRVRKAREHRLSRAAILPDHVHLALGAALQQSPESIALTYLNNLAYACGMKQIFAYNYFIATFGEYDLGVIPPDRTRAEDAGGCK